MKKLKQDIEKITVGMFIVVTNTGENEGKSELELEVKRVTSEYLFSEECFVMGIRGTTPQELKNKIVRWGKGNRRFNENYNSYKIIGYYDKEDYPDN